MKTTIITLIGLVALTACNPNSKNSENKNDSRINNSAFRVINGSDETQMFLSKYMGKFVEPKFHENLIIGANGTVSRLQVRQVGGTSNSKVPYPTVCSYFQTGKITLVENRDITDRQKYMDFATHLIEVQYNDIVLTNELNSSTISDLNCQTFMTEMKTMIKERGYIQYSYYTELLSDDSFRIHTSGGGDYQQGGPRTPSTLDEVYTKVK